MLKQIIIVCTIFYAVSALEKVRHDNCSLYRLVPTIHQIGKLQDFQNSHSDYDFWNSPHINNRYVSVLVSPKQKSELNEFLFKNRIKFEITLPNVQEVIDSQERTNLKRSSQFTWDAYYSQEEIEAWVISLQAAYPSVITLVNGGVTYEGRNITGVKLSHGPGRRVIVIEGGIHAREWISPATVTYILNELLTSKDDATQQAAREFDWYIFPVTNPDGYKHSYDSSRLWRKNRRPINVFSYGVDLNRNFDANWMVAGSSNVPSNDAYAGPSPFSEPETKSYSDFLRTIGDKTDIYLSFHSYGQMLLLPFGNTTAHLANYEESMNVGRKGLAALSEKYGTRYTIGNIAETIYLATGGSIDWVKEALGVPITYCYELRDLGRTGFLLPSSEIVPTGEETIASVLAIIREAKDSGVI